MPLFLDACALAKRYLHEGRSSSRMQTITGRPKRWGGLIVSSFIEIEVVSSIAKAAREYPNPFGRAEAIKDVPRTVDTFLRDYRSGVFTVIQASEDIHAAAIGELRDHPRHSIGAGDAIHLVTAIGVAADARAPVVFATADQGLYEAAMKHGLPVFNPNFEDESALQRKFDDSSL